MTPEATPNADLTLRVLLGIGNPGERYEGTHHNLGFDVVRAVARSLGVAWSVLDHPQSGEPLAEVARHETSHGPLLLVCPLTYVNLSGQVVPVLDPDCQWDPAQVLVVTDDLDLPVGRLRVRRSGSDGCS